MKRFLITTALEQTWYKTDVPVLFLGEWCKLFSEKEKWKKLSYETLPYHWDDRKKLYQDYQYLDNLYEETLLQLKVSLNKLHGEDHTIRYWRIILGPWLYTFIQILYDRYLSIKSANDYDKVVNTIIHKTSIDKWIPRDHNTFSKWLTTDSYNHYLYGQIIELTGKFNFTYIRPEKGEDTIMNNIKISYFDLSKKILRKIMGKLTKIIPNKFNQIVIISSYLKMFDLIKLQLSLKQIPYLFPPDLESPITKSNLNLRNKLVINVGSGKFELLINKLIFKHIPINCIEAFKQMKDESIESLPKDPKLIFTANAHDSNDHFKFWSAYHVEKGVKFIGAQHGGHYGTGRWASADNHELKIFDEYITWGWKSNKYKNTVSLPSAQLSGIKKVKPINNKITLLFLELPQYSYHLYSCPISASGMKSYLNDQYNFIKSLSKTTQNKLVIRLHQSANYNWDQKNQLKLHFPDIEIYNGRKSFINDMKQNSLVICTYNATSFLESFSANLPTVMFWNPKHWELNKKAQYYYDKLREVNILHDSPESAASIVENIISDPMKWWKQKEVQRIKDQFCQVYARTSKDSLEVLNKALKHT